MQHLMELQKLCDFCKEQRSMIYCRSDAAYLCLSCDRSVHSANALSSRHLRTLVCERCNCQIAIVRCLEEKLSLCQNCNSSGHGTPASPTKHKRQTINSYSGCPSAAELSNIWSFFYPDKSNCNPEADSVILEDCSKCLSQCPLAQEATMDPIDSDVEQLHGIESFDSPDQKDFDISEMDWGMENCEALFGESLNDDPQQLFEDGGYDSFFGIGNLCGTECSEESTHEVKGTNLKSKTTQQACSNSVSADSDTSSKSDPDTSSKSDPDTLSPRPAQCSFSPSFHDPTADHETGAHQPSRVSSMPTVLEDRSCTGHHPEYRLSSAIRDCAVLRYKEKRKSRKFDRKVRYASRKAGAEVRKRVKGRFVKAGDPYDYDPMHLTKEFTMLSKVFQETHVA